MSVEAKKEEEAARRLSLQAVRRLLRLAWPHRSLLLVGGVLTLLNTGITLSLPLFARKALNRILQTHAITSLDHLALGLFGLITVGAAISYFQLMLVAYVGNRIVRDMRAQMFGHLLDLPVAYFDRTRSGDLASHLSNDVSQVQQTLTEDLVRMVGNIATLIGGVGLAVVIDARLTAVVVGALLLALGLIAAMGMRVRRYSRASLDALSDAMGTMQEALANVRLVKAFARERHEQNRTGEKLDRVLALALRASQFEAGLSTVASIGFIGILIGILWYGGRGVLTGQLSAGSLLAFLMTITLISGPMASLAAQYARLQRALGAAERCFAILDEAGEPIDRADARPFPEGPAHVSFEGIRFAYTPDCPVLEGLSLTLLPGAVTALVGASGSGKTTLAALLYRFYEPQAGTIRINERPIDSLRRIELREHIGLVPQEPVLFNASLRDNIRYGRLGASDDEVEQAAKAANVAEFARQLPEGYETVLGERGVTLSGGQRQRVAIARALLKDPRILILDEATSALDTRSEALVRDALERLMRGRTTLVIAHRLTTIRHADQIAVLDGGQVVELGVHDDLLGRDGHYAALHNASTAPADALMLSDA